MGKVKSPKKKNDSKAEKEKKLMIGPKLRLEPRLKPKSSKSDKKDVTWKLLEENNCEIGYQDASFSRENSKSCIFIEDTHEQSVNPETSINGYADNNNSNGDNSNFESKHNVTDSKIVDSVKNSIVEESGNASFKNPEFPSRNIMKAMRENKKNRNSLNKIAINSVGWSNRELMDLAIGLQTKGFADLKAVADCVKTKKEDEIRQFLNRKIYDSHRRQPPSRGRPPTKFHTKVPEAIKLWPNARKWRRLAFNQMISYSRRMDYSKPAIEALCKKFYEEEKETSNPEVINVKLIYKYMMDCMAGQIPPQLPPKESAIVLELLRETQLIPIAFDFEQERKFLNDFRAAIKFKPFQVKDEFKRRIKKEENASEPSEEKSPEPSAVGIPEELFLNLSRHKKTIQGFNPLVTPIWMVQKEQECLEEYYKESNVYVD